MKELIILIAMAVVIASFYFFDGFMLAVGVALAVALAAYSDEINAAMKKNS